MLDKATAYIATNPNTILWVLILLTVAVVYLYYVAYLSGGGKPSTKKSRRRKKQAEEDIEDGELPEPDDASPKISKDRLAELERL